MKFNPHTNRLFADNGILIKNLHCPFRQNWSNLDETNDPAIRQCGICQHPIIDTAFKTDDQLLALLKINPDSCLNVDLQQNNVLMIHQDEAYEQYTRE